ncbi:MAG: hypothetical protein KGD70_14680 [Candidatus Lokiarchaeota archaeon]|nr:hypothetical protein [Candidatus Lokiarchaeota archaeon]
MDNYIDIRYNEDLANKIGLNGSIIYDYLVSKISEKEYFLDIDDIYNDLPIIGRTTMINLVNKMIMDGYLKEIVLTNIEKYKIISNKQMDGLGIGNRTCDWCSCKTTTLHKHHYPIQKKDGGIQLVNICPNCHYEFHHLKSKLEII